MIMVMVVMMVMADERGFKVIRLRGEKDMRWMGRRIIWIGWLLAGDLGEGPAVMKVMASSQLEWIGRTGFGTSGKGEIGGKRSEKEGFSK